MPRSSGRRLSFFVSSLLLRSWGEVSYFGVGVLAFGTWLETRIANAEYKALGLGEVVTLARSELKLEREAAIRLLARVTRAGERFVSDGQIVTFRG